MHVGHTRAHTWCRHVRMPAAMSAGHGPGCRACLSKSYAPYPLRELRRPSQGGALCCQQVTAPMAVPPGQPCGVAVPGLGQYMPTGQGTHIALRVRRAYMPAGTHGRRCVCWGGGGYQRRWHDDDRPPAGRAAPSAHGLLRPHGRPHGLAWQAGGMRGCRCASPCRSPAGHGWQSELPRGAKLPAGHTVQLGDALRF